MTDDPYGDMGGPAGPPRPQQQRSGGGSGGGAQSAIESGKYTEVKVRIQKFYAAYPTGAIVTTKITTLPIHELDDKPRIMVQAEAYRTPDDPHPGTGSAWMVLPGKTPYTNGSELENCETSAWGRAIAAVGIAIDQGIATAQDIRSKHGGEVEAPSVVGSQQLAAAAAEAAGATGEPVPEADSPQVPLDTPTVLPVAGSDLSVNAEPMAPAPDPVAEAPEEPKKPSPKRSGKSVAPTPDPEAQAAPEGTVTGIDYAEFIRLVREKFIPNGHVATVARELVEAKAIRQVGGVKELSDDERLTLLYACIARKDDEPNA